MILEVTQASQEFNQRLLTGYVGTRPGPTDSEDLLAYLKRVGYIDHSLYGIDACASADRTDAGAMIFGQLPPVEGEIQKIKTKNKFTW